MSQTDTSVCLYIHGGMDWGVGQPSSSGTSTPACLSLGVQQRTPDGRAGGRADLPTPSSCLSVRVFAGTPGGHMVASLQTMPEQMPHIPSSESRPSSILPPGAVNRAVAAGPVARARGKRGWRAEGGMCSPRCFKGASYPPERSHGVPPKSLNRRPSPRPASTRIMSPGVG